MVQDGRYRHLVYSVLHLNYLYIMLFLAFVQTAIKNIFRTGKAPIFLSLFEAGQGIGNLAWPRGLEVLAASCT